MNDALDLVRKQIANIIKSRYPHLPNYAINDEALRTYLKDHKGDVEAIARELIKVIVARNKIRRKMKVIK